MVVAFLRQTLLPSDDCLYAIRHLMSLQAYGAALGNHANDDWGALARGGKPLPPLPAMRT